MKRKTAVLKLTGGREWRRERKHWSRATGSESPAQHIKYTWNMGNEEKKVKYGMGNASKKDGVEYRNGTLLGLQY